MAIRTLEVNVSGIKPLLMNNPQTVDRFNPYTREMAKITAKKTRRTDEDYREYSNIEVRAKLYFDPVIKVYIPATWVTAAVAAASFKKAKISKADIRGSVFATEDKVKLYYRDQAKVVTEDDIVGNSDFRLAMTLKQQQVRVVKHTPIFHQWKFSTKLEFDDKLIDPASLIDIIQHASQYGGYGDFRPTFGRAIAEVTCD
ncbi:MAG: hypothetical protein ACR2IJ_06530 [Fluviibacter sp.]